MEMHLDATRPMDVSIGSLGMDVRFEAGESIWTEISRKFTVDEIRSLLAGSGVTVEATFVDADHPYLLALGRVEA